MPLVKCRDCGKEVSTSAVVCPNCGLPEPGLYGPSEVIFYRKWAFAAGGLKVKVYIDDEFVGEVGNGKSLNFQVVPGEKTVCLQAPLSPSRKYQYVFSDGKKYSFEMVVDLLLGGFKLKP